MNNCVFPQVKAPSSSSSAASDASSPSALVFRRGWCSSETIVGSSFVEMGASKLACYAYAPRPATGRAVSFEEGLLEVKVSFAAHLSANHDLHDDVRSAEGQSHLERALALAITDAIKPAVRLNAYPKAVLSLSMVVLQSSVQDLAAAINAASLALTDGAVQLRDLVTAYTLQQQLAADYEPFACTVAAMVNAQDLTLVQTVGSRSPEVLLATVQLAQQQCAALRQKMSEYIKSSAADTAQSTQ